MRDRGPKEAVGRASNISRGVNSGQAGRPEETEGVGSRGAAGLERKGWRFSFKGFHPGCARDQRGNGTAGTMATVTVAARRFVSLEGWPIVHGKKRVVAVVPTRGRHMFSRYGAVDGVALGTLRRTHDGSQGRSGH